MKGKQVRLYLADGSAGGLMTAEIFNWTGHILKGKRTELARILSREEASRTGVYILFGTNKEDKPSAYIGEGDNVGTRILQHSKKKEFWEDVVLITSKDTNLTKAHVRYLEAEFCTIAKMIGRYELDNGTSPTGGATLPEADESDMRYFIQQVQILMPVLGYNIFRGRMVPIMSRTVDDASAPTMATERIPTSLEAKASSPVFHLRNGSGIHAQAQIIDGEFILLAGSLIAKTMRVHSNATSSTKKQFARRQVTHRQILEASEESPQPGLIRTLKDYACSSPSAAAAVAYGRASANGRILWTTADGQEYGEWETAQSGIK